MTNFAKDSSSIKNSQQNHPYYRTVILLIDDDKKKIKPMVSAFEKLARNLYSQYGLEFLCVDNSDTALEKIKHDPDVQAVLMDWYLDMPNQEDIPPHERIPQVPSKQELVQQIQKYRPEVPVYIMTFKKSGMPVMDECPEAKSFFSKIEDRIQEVLGRIMTDFSNRLKTPFWTSYKNYVDSAKDSWHTPGHSGGTSFLRSPYLFEFYEYFGEHYFRGDLSVSVGKLGSLLDSTGPIGEAQALAAKTFHVAKTFFATNGSSTSNKIILQTLLKPNDKVIVDRNCHKSVHYGIIMSGAIPIYLKSDYSSKLGIFAPPRMNEIQMKIEQNPDAKLLVLTGCTYDGILMNLKEVVAYAHDHGLKVFVDEAWFAYSYFHYKLRPFSAIAAGADYITHSAHKVLSAFSQASLIHVNDTDFDEDFFRENFYIYTSTSPQYTMIASLDVARMQMEVEGFKRIQETIVLAEEFRSELKKNKYIRTVEREEYLKEFNWLENDKIDFDPLKVLVDISGLNMEINDVHKYLQENGGVEIEKTTHSTFLVLFTIGATSPRVTRLYKAIRDLESQPVRRKKDKLEQIRKDIDIPNLEVKMPLRDFFYAPKKEICIEASEGLVAATIVTPYPPGIPILVPGQCITNEHIDFLKPLIEQGTEIHGCHKGKIYVIDDSKI